MQTVINIPFPGFYESSLSGIVDHECESFAEYENEKQDSEYHKEDNFPPALQVDVSQFAWECVDYSAAYLEIARDYVESLDDWLTEAARDIDPDAPVPGLTFCGMDSPREYNFSTDQVDCYVNESFVEWLFQQSKKAGHGELIKTLERRHKSRDGFISFYSHRLADWLAKPVSEWDYHELRSLLESVFPALNDPDSAWEIEQSLHENGWQYFESNMDWQKYDSKLADARADALLAWIESEPQSAREWAGNNADKLAPFEAASPEVSLWAMGENIPYRCALTPDLFAGA